jgi:hypothetical protein
MSGDGRYVVFQSDAWNIVPDDTNGVSDIFVHDTRTGKTFRASVSTSGVEANGYSANATISTRGPPRRLRVRRLQPGG